MIFTLIDNYYIDNVNLSDTENDILFYINKFSWLSFTEINYLIKLDIRNLRSYLKSLYNNCYIHKTNFYGILIFKLISSNEGTLKFRESTIIVHIEKKLKNGALTKENINKILIIDKICFDIRILEAILDKSNFHYFQENRKKWYYKTQTNLSNKIKFCPKCSNLIIKGKCRNCNYEMSWRKKNNFKN